eukprot:CAMPEP_0117609886 /NCGR_PEP_ID=MMETSP0784-20121206/81576_1 /TAXON_ID=39447 /ORGANISM="" /LENGTH=64 /DNA_ID=CAMNT_0005413247 /DNA_START=45 /DNA_END=235 /DNA_ORIENTATION=-
MGTHGPQMDGLDGRISMHVRLWLRGLQGAANAISELDVGRHEQSHAAMRFPRPELLAQQLQPQP